ncbi:Swi5-dependent recombination DNA repair protein 1-like protein [Frankliniella fusca]|uniref:Swi5-dependent recombination DNA repair protein 1 homolog n=1 Tax=Frankliniella fusca TaxID=407009 RepID=A0AAE1HCY8_9NEOP|nr:Swi5-dependent recombination DNA repair protein 1-like protein [Frankliniella fusca]
MEQGSSKTPCRRIGLRRIASASKAEPCEAPATSKSADFKPHDRVSKSRAGLFSSSSSSSSKDMHAPNFRSQSSHVMPTESWKSTHTAKSSLNARKSDSELNYPESSPCSSRVITGEENKCQERNSKKPKLDLTETITVEDLHALQRQVGLKERKLKELRQAEVICKKHNPNQLREDIKTWLQACQAALQELLNSLHSRGGQIDMNRLLCELGIPSKLVRYNDETDDFE